MGHGKETPRQKMIGMMYLVLTALLALNVSKDILNAFVLVDQGLNKTVDNFSSKSAILYNALEKAKQSNPAKAGEFHSKAVEVKTKADELVRYIDELKVKLYETADGVKVGIDTVRNYDLQAKDNQDIGGQIMIVVDKKGRELKEKINAYREDLKKLTDPKTGEQLRAQLDKGLNTEDPKKPNAGGQMETWESSNFEHLPLVAVTTMLTKMQTDIRNAEADVVGYLASQIGADDFRFNKIEAIVKPESNYILRGDQYKAEIFIAASDSTAKPTIQVGGRALEVKQGKAIYTGDASSVGLKNFGGVIKLITPSTGTVKEYPFKAEYQVAEPSVTVSPTKMNVFYIGVPNPVDVLASGIPANKIKPSISAGSIEPAGKDGQYVVRVKKTGPVKISIQAEIGGKVVSMGSKDFRVKTVPDPIAKVADMTGGVIGLNVLQVQSGVAAVLENFDFDLQFIVKSFNVSATVKGYEEDASSNSYQFTPQQKALIAKLRPQAKVYITDIKAQGPDGTLRSLPSIAFKLK